MRATTDLSSLVDCELVLFDVNSEGMRNAMQKIKPYICSKTIFVVDTKGIERETGNFPLEIAAQELPTNKLAVRSGWMSTSHMNAKLWCYADIGAYFYEVAKCAKEVLDSSNFTHKVSLDPVGVQYSGPLKNAFTTLLGAISEINKCHPKLRIIIESYWNRGIEEASRAAESFGAKPETFAYASNFSIDFLKSISNDTANFMYGREIGSGLKPKEAALETLIVTGRVPESYFTTSELARKIGSGVTPMLDAAKSINEGENVEEALEKIGNEFMHYRRIKRKVKMLR